MVDFIDDQLENMDIGEASSVPTLSKRRKLLTEARTEITEAFQNLTNQIDTKGVFPGLRRYYTTTFDVEDLLQIENYEQLLDALLKRNNGNVKLVIVSLYEALQNSDAEEIASNYLETLYIKFKQQENSIRENRPLYGRAEMLSTLHRYMESVEHRVVNVCGMAGIGKSHLVKWLVWEMESCTYYADCSGSPRCIDIVRKLLENMGYSCTDDESDCRSSLLSLLAHRPDERVVLVIDDIMPLLTESEQMSRSEMMEFLKLILSILNSHRKVKVLLTSQDLLRGKEYGESRLTSLMEKLNNCWIDVPLERLEKQSDCVKLVVSDDSQITPDVQTLIDKCHGHPFALSLLSTYISLGEVDSLLVTKMAQDAELMFRGLFKYRMKNLSLTDVDILEHLSIFPNQVTVQDLYGTYYYNQPNKNTMPQIEEFWKTLKALSPYFVIDFLDSSTDLSIGKRIVRCHHPSVKFYFYNQLETTDRYANTD